MTHVQPSDDKGDGQDSIDNLDDGIDNRDVGVDNVDDGIDDGIHNLDGLAVAAGTRKSDSKSFKSGKPKSALSPSAALRHKGPHPNHEVQEVHQMHQMHQSLSPSPAPDERRRRFDLLHTVLARGHKGPHPSHEVQEVHEMHQMHQSSQLSRNQRTLSSPHGLSDSESLSPRGGGDGMGSRGALFSTSFPQPPTLDAPQRDAFSDDKGRAGGEERSSEHMEREHMEREAPPSSSLLSSLKSRDPSDWWQEGADEAYMYASYDEGARRGPSSSRPTSSRAFCVPSASNSDASNMRERDATNTDKTSVAPWVSKRVRGDDRPPHKAQVAIARGGKEGKEALAHESLPMLRTPTVRGFA